MHIVHIHRGPHVREVMRADSKGRLAVDVHQDHRVILADAQLTRHAQEQRTAKELAGCRIKAIIPMGVYLQSRSENWGKKEWRRWLNDPANRLLRIDGRHGD